jgi:hypothetical protein
MQVRFKHLAIPVSIIAGVGAALVTTAVAQSGGRTAQAVVPSLQQLPPTSAHLTGPDEFRTGAGANPTGHPTATGNVLITVNEATNEICAYFTPSDDLGPYLAFHLHEGTSDVRNAPVSVNFNVTPGTSGPLAKCVIDAANAPSVAIDPASFYFNVHTTAFPTGAISGQLSRTSETQLLSTPFRAYDTRFNTAGKFAPATTRTIDLTASGIPLGARAAIVTVTVTRADANGFLTVYSAALATAPNTSNVNFTANQDIANNITVALDATRSIKITSGATGTQPGAVGSNEDVIVDVVGYVV